MIRVEVGIRYRSQLRRTRPDEMARIESMAESILRNSGGAVFRESDVLRAEFDETIIAFWLDLVIALEGVSEAVASIEKELLGWSCLVRWNPAETQAGRYPGRELTRLRSPSGVWCDEKVMSALAEYASFARAGDYHALTCFTFRKRKPHDAREFWIRPALEEHLYSLRLSDLSYDGKAVAIEGAPFLGKRQTLRSALAHISSSVRVFRIAFDERSGNLSSIADAVTDDRLMEIATADAAAADALRARLGVVRLIRAERLSVEISPTLRTVFDEFFAAFTESWVGAVAKSRKPLFVVENAHLADAASRAMLRSAFDLILSDGRVRLLLTGTGVQVFDDICSGGYDLIRVGAPDSQELAPLISDIRASFGLPAADEVLVGRCLSMSARNGVAAGYRLAIGWNLGSSGRPISVHPHLTEDLLEAAYALSLSCELLASNEWTGCLASEQKPGGALPLTLERLAELGVIEDVGFPRSAIPGFSKFAEISLGDRGRVVRELMRRKLLEAIEDKRLSNSFETIAELVKLGGEPDENQVLDAVVEGVVRRQTKAVERALQNGSFAAVVGADRAAALADIFRSRAALLFGGESDIREAFSQPMPESFPSARYRAYALLDRAASTFFSGPLTPAVLVQASQSAKNALLLLQGNPADKGLPRAYRLLGETELSRERINEAVDYFTFASESAERSGERYEALLSSVNETCTQYLLGNLSNAQRYAEKAERRAEKLYLGNWLLWSRFMQGRILFEIGRYDRAAELFDALARRAGTAAGLLRNWRDRSLVYGNPAKSFSFLDDTADASFFRLEASFLNGEFEAAVRLADAYLSAPPPETSRNSERVDWSSGFGLVEDRAIGRTGSDRIVRRLTRVYRALSLAKISNPVEAAAELHKIAREEPIPELDPYDSFYFWALSVALRDAGAEPIDWHTLLSIAFKRLQRRASRIDDAEVKRAYISSNRWNGALYSDAKMINLI